LRISVMARCAATPRICELAKEVAASTTIAMPAAAASIGRMSHRPLVNTSSIRYLVVVGSTRPDRRLITIRSSPMASRLRWVQMSARASSTAPLVIFFAAPAPAGFDGCAPGAGRAPRLRSALPRPLIFTVTPSVKLSLRRGGARLRQMGRVQFAPSDIEPPELDALVRWGGVRSALQEHSMSIRHTLALVAVLAASPAATAQRQADLEAAAAQIIKVDAEFAKAVADRNRDRFLSFIADTTTFSGGTANELRGKEAVWKVWSDFFAPDGPTLTWTPTKGEVIGAADVGYTTGRAVMRARGADGKVTERHTQYITVWKKQGDGSWKVIFDTGPTLP
jgi:ketosteroid isomerase-like protein